MQQKTVCREAQTVNYYTFYKYCKICLIALHICDSTQPVRLYPSQCNATDCVLYHWLRQNSLSARDIPFRPKRTVEYCASICIKYILIFDVCQQLLQKIYYSALSAVCKSICCNFGAFSHFARFFAYSTANIVKCTAAVTTHERG